jgi:hypothetical protein
MIDAKLIIALWAAVTALGSSFVAERYLRPVIQHRNERLASAEPTLRKLPSLTVPIVTDGRVQGYVVAKLSWQADATLLKALSHPPDAFVLDEAFGVLYSEAAIDFRKLQRSDLVKIRQDILARVGTRLKSAVAVDLLVEEFNYVPRSEVGR